MKVDRLHYITRQTPTQSHTKAALKALKAGCKWIQLRVKDTQEAEVLKMGFIVKQMCEDYGAKLIINDYPEIAAQVQAYGLHLGLTDCSIENARIITENKCVIGGTTNTYKDVIKRIHEGADYVGLGPYRFTNTKNKLSPILGLAGITAIMDALNKQNIKIPVIAIGGIREEDISLLMNAGVHGVALSGAIELAKNGEQTVKNMYNILAEQHQTIIT